MATLIPDEEFADLEVLAQALMARSREVAGAMAVFPADTPEEMIALSVEVQAFDCAMMALAKITPMQPRPLFVAFGAAIGVVLAQQTEPQGQLMKACFDQMRSTFDQIVEAQRPKGNA